MVDPVPSATPTSESGRRERVLESAMLTFARFGYRKTAMDDVAKDAGISRPGLYFYFASKAELFRAAVVHTLEGDLAAAEHSLAAESEPLADRLTDAFDLWSGRYISGLAREIPLVVLDQPELLGAISRQYSERFALLITAAVAAREGTTRAEAIAQTLISTAIGIKSQVDSRDAFRHRLGVAIGLLVPAPATPDGS
jgi:AcrR family transcriptional regulator